MVSWSGRRPRSCDVQDGNPRSDLQTVDSNATAMDILALVLKQLAALGVPGPHDIARLQRTVFDHVSPQR